MFRFSKFSFNYSIAIPKEFLLSHIFSTSAPQWNWPNAATPLLGHPARQLVNKPTPTKCDQSEASELNQAKAKAKQGNHPKTTTTTCTSTIRTRFRIRFCASVTTAKLRRGIAAVGSPNS